MNLLTIRDFGTVYNAAAFIVIIILFLQFVNSFQKHFHSNYGRVFEFAVMYSPHIQSFSFE